MSEEVEAARANAFVRFFDHVDMDGNGIGCWVWTAKKTRGYGYYSIGGKSYRAARWLYQAIHGSVPDDLVIRHKCDNPECVNPRHLTVGTHADNAQDCVERGRRKGRPGEAHHSAKVNEEIVRRIRAMAAAGEPNPSIAARVGIDTKHVGQIVRRDTWRHIP